MTDTNITIVKQRIEQLLRDKHISQREASRVIGKNDTYMNKFLHEPTPERLDEQSRSKLARLLNVDEQELTDIDLTDRKLGSSPAYMTKEELLEIIDGIDFFMKKIGKRLETKDKIELAYEVNIELKSKRLENQTAKILHINEYLTARYAA